jgi:hypothetical protein
MPKPPPKALSDGYFRRRTSGVRSTLFLEKLAKMHAISSVLTPPRMLFWGEFTQELGRYIGPSSGFKPTWTDEKP